tara:strand:- start:1414 stop:1986 length:573 start_codon:yes stop_codon:yes gene_type:complete
MGYTHYFRWHKAPTDEQWDAIRAKFLQCAHRAPEFTGTAGGYHEEDPLAIDAQGETEGVFKVASKNSTIEHTFVSTESMILFNGCEPADGGGEADLGHETMLLERTCTPEDWQEDAFKSGEGIFNFCKTARKPYDLLVCALLLVCENEAPGCWTIRSDGDWSEWKQAINLVNEIYGLKGGIRTPEAIDPA